MNKVSTEFMNSQFFKKKAEPVVDRFDSTQNQIRNSKFKLINDLKDINDNIKLNLSSKKDKEKFIDQRNLLDPNEASNMKFKESMISSVISNIQESEAYYQKVLVESNQLDIELISSPRQIDELSLKMQNVKQLKEKVIK